MTLTTSRSRRLVITSPRPVRALVAFLVAGLIAAASPAPAAAWTLQKHFIHEHRDASGVFIKLDGAGRQHIVYESSGEIFYLTNKSGTWKTRKILGESDSVSGAVLLDLFVTSGGKVYVTYRGYVDFDQRVRFATNASGFWKHRAAVRSDHHLYTYHAEIAVRSGTAYIIYEPRPNDYDDSGPRGLWLRTFHSDGTVSARRLSSQVHWYADVAVDRDSNLHVVAGTDGGIRYLTNRSGTWTAKIISGTGANSFPRIALNGRKAHVAWHRCITDCSGDADTTVYATNQSGSWSRQTVTAKGKGGSASIAYSKGVHLAWYHQTGTLAGDQIRYLTNQGGTWTGKNWSHARFGDTEGWVIDYPSVDAIAGQAFVAYSAFQYYVDPTAAYVYVRRE